MAHKVSHFCFYDCALHSFFFCAPFAFFTLAQQASCVFLVVVLELFSFCFHFLRPFFFVLFTAQP
jgi:hypothetical protein